MAGLDASTGKRFDRTAANDRASVVQPTSRDALRYTALYKNPYTTCIPARMNIRMANTMWTTFQYASKVWAF